MFGRYTFFVISTATCPLIFAWTWAVQTLPVIYLVLHH